MQHNFSDGVSKSPINPLFNQIKNTQNLKKEISYVGNIGIQGLLPLKNFHWDQAEAMDYKRIKTSDISKINKRLPENQSISFKSDLKNFIFKTNLNPVGKKSSRSDKHNIKLILNKNNTSLVFREGLSGKKKNLTERINRDKLKVSKVQIYPPALNECRPTASLFSLSFMKKPKENSPNPKFRCKSAAKIMTSSQTKVEYSNNTYKLLSDNKIPKKKNVSIQTLENNIIKETLNLKKRKKNLRPKSLGGLELMNPDKKIFDTAPEKVREESINNLMDIKY